MKQEEAIKKALDDNQINKYREYFERVILTFVSLMDSEFKIEKVYILQEWQLHKSGYEWINVECTKDPVHAAKWELSDKRRKVEMILK